MRSVALCNLGCSKNIIDGESIIAYLEANGFALVNDAARADVILVNTCAFIQEAKQEAIDTILEMASCKKEGRHAHLVVAGCFSERYRAQAAKLLPEVDLWLGLAGWKRQLSGYLHLGAARRGEFRHLTGHGASQYLKISEGCSHKCAFCAVPLIRGPFRSRSPRAILKEARWLEAQGVRECILVSQDTSFYGRDRKTALVKLLEQLLRRTSFEWIRLMYLHPRWISRELIRLIAGEPRLCSYFDMPLQHIADPLLAAMGRTPGSKAVHELIETIRTKVPDAAIRTTFITGLPGETEAHFAQLLKFITWARFEKLGVFPYSPEEGTRACTMAGRPRQKTAVRRCEILMHAQREISSGILESLVGSVVPVLADRASDESPALWEARTQWDAPEIDGTVYLKKYRGTPGGIINARVTGSSDYDLEAVVM
ncbi:MAG: 30S ribosomal protein S12 methylthiotransferase RimO [Chitinivibrionales bacterium]|nr:30S ribosomal protein S12 methylthiotransferase RimO [Chitinivibrionales bacterium]MBD3394166.1 30S ribosomal protein S12 methylthiotransferase RimO [Chitinivibrionales bacterium]